MAIIPLTINKKRTSGISLTVRKRGVSVPVAEEKKSIYDFFRQPQMSFMPRQEKPVEKKSTLERATSLYTKTLIPGAQPELGLKVLEFGKSVGQAIARSFLATGKFIKEFATAPYEPTKYEKPAEFLKEVAEKTYTPIGKTEQAIFGTDKPVSFKTVGDEVLAVGGEDFAKKWGAYSIPVGMLVAGLDIIPIGWGKKEVAKGAAKIISKTDDVAKIANVLKKVTKGSDETIGFLAKSLRTVNKEEDVIKIINRAVKGVKEAPVLAGKGITTAPPGIVKPAQVVPGEAVARPKPPMLEESLEIASRESRKIPSESTSHFSDTYASVYNKTGGISRTKDLQKAELKINPTEINVAKIGTYKKFKESATNAWTATREFIQDDWIRVKRLIDRPDVRVTEASNMYQRETLFHGRVAARIREAKEVVTKVDKDIISTAKTLNITDATLKDEVNRYLWAKHTPERNLAIGERAAGISTKEANKMMSALKGSPHSEDIVRLADDISNFNKKTLDILLDGGVIDRELHTLLRTKYKNHVPLQRIFGETENIREVMSGKGFDVQGTGIKTARGSERDVADIFTNVVTNYEQAIIRAEKNIVDNSTLKFVRENKAALGGLIEEIKPQAIGRTFEGKILTERITDPTVLALRENGKAIYLKINDKHLAAALKGVNRQKVDGILRFVKAFTRLYSSLATRFNPEFAFPNKVRDLQEAMVYLAAKKDVGFKSAAKITTRDAGSVKDIMNYLRGVDNTGTKLYKEMIMEGGTTGGLGLSTRSQVELSMEEIAKLNRSNPRKATEKIIRSVDGWNTIFEDSTRLSVYKEAKARGLSIQRAAVLAKEASVNFNKFGTAGPVINSLYMFANASIQGSAKMLGAMKNPKVATTVVLATGTATFAVNEWNDRVDPEWREKVSKWDRMNGLTTVLPTDEGIRYFTIPVSWGIKPIKVAADAAYDLMAGEGESLTESIGTVIASVVEGYNPVGGSDIVSAATPSILDLPIELARNKSWTGNKIKPDWDQNAPESIKYFKSIEESATGRASVLMTGELSNVGIEISPEDVDHAYRNLIGGAGRFVSKTINTFTSIGKGEVPETREIPFISRFLRARTEEEVGSGSSQAEDIKKILGEQSREKFYSNQAAEKKHKELIDMDKEKAKGEFDRIIKENPEMAKKINTIIKEEALGLNYNDRLVLQLGVENGERAEYIYEQTQKLKTQEEKQKYYQGLIDKRIVSEKVSSQINSLIREEENKVSGFGLLSNYVKAFMTDPGNAFKALLTKEKLGIVEGNLVELQRFYGIYFRDQGGSEEYKSDLMRKQRIPSSEIKNWKLEHIVPVKAGGDTSDKNLMLVNNEMHDFFTPIDIAIGNAVKDGRITRKEAEKLMRDFKVDKKITAEEVIASLLKD